MQYQWIYLLIVFVVVFAVAMLIASQLAPNRTRSRLEALSGDAAPMAVEGPRPGAVWVARVLNPLASLSLPAEGWEQSPLRVRFMNAGWRDKTALPLYFGGKTLLALLLPALAYLGWQLFGKADSQASLPLMLLAAAIGYYLPNVILSRRIAARQLEIFENFPDAIDLLLVCVEAGLGLDAALMRVGEEIRLKSPLLADELHLVNLELRAGSGRERALRNLALRTGVAEVDSLVSMLVQADRFGTSIGESLRVHADDLRTKRRQRAEETAAKIPVKLLFPLIFCIFPALLLVLLGPAFIQIYRILLPTLTGASGQ